MIELQIGFRRDAIFLFRIFLYVFLIRPDRSGRFSHFEEKKTHKTKYDDNIYIGVNQEV